MLRMINHFGDPLTFQLVPLSNQNDLCPVLWTMTLPSASSILCVSKLRLTGTKTIHFFGKRDVLIQLYGNFESCSLCCCLGVLGYTDLVQIIYIKRCRPSVTILLCLRQTIHHNNIIQYIYMDIHTISLTFETTLL